MRTFTCFVLSFVALVFAFGRVARADDTPFAASRVIQSVATVAGDQVVQAINASTVQGGVFVNDPAKQNVVVTKDTVGQVAQIFDLAAVQHGVFVRAVQAVPVTHDDVGEVVQVPANRRMAVATDAVGPVAQVISRLAVVRNGVFVKPVETDSIDTVGQVIQVVEPTAVVWDGAVASKVMTTPHGVQENITTDRKTGVAIDTVGRVAQVCRAAEIGVFANVVMAVPVTNDGVVLDSAVPNVD